MRSDNVVKYVLGLGSAMQTSEYANNYFKRSMEIYGQNNQYRSEDQFRMTPKPGAPDPREACHIWYEYGDCRQEIC